MDELTNFINSLVSTGTSVEQEVAYLKTYMLLTTAALAWLILRDARRR